jgi:polyhydroxybutyrate depolymerase
VGRQSGNFQENIAVGDVNRTYTLHQPATIGAAGLVPLVLAFHGAGGQGPSMAGLTGLNAVADQQGFVVAYPDGIDRHWNDGRPVGRQGPGTQYDDVAFVRALIDHLTTTRPIDPARVYATGMSNGAIVSQRLACDLSDKIAAVAPVAGSLAEALAPICTPNRPVPILMIMGEADPFVPWAGGQVKGLGFGPVLSVADTIAYWVTHNGCNPIPTITQEPDRAPDDGTTVRRESYTGCRANADVILYAVTNGGHAWPGGIQYLPESTIGKTNRDIDATTIIWDFFAAHPQR